MWYNFYMRTGFQNKDGVTYEPTNLKVLYAEDLQAIVDAILAKADADHNHSGVYAPALGTDDNYVTDAEKSKLANVSPIVAATSAPIAPEDGALWLDTSVALDAPTRSADVTKIVALSQSEYDALTPNASTLYVIVE